MSALAPTRSATSLEQMRADAVLPPDIVPANADASPTGAILLTGATGFVGAHLLHVLLRDTPNRVACLVRPDRAGLPGLERVRRNLEVHGLWEAAWGERIRPVAGDLRRPRLGWTDAEFGALAASVDGIYHSAAAVNWVRPYAGLRATNVLGTVELLRLACRTRAKRFHFLSTIGVCYAIGPEAQPLTEADDCWPLLDRLHLGYAQSKAVAERLVEQARQRGLPAVIYRPSLITGDSRSGNANPDDFLSRTIGACVRMGCAPDVDWNIDACPVDHVARVMVRHALPGEPTLHDRAHHRHTLHLLPAQPRQWRELLLWMRLFGYPLRLLSYRDWLRRLEQTGHAPDHPLHPLLGFFHARVGNLSLPETYLGRRRTGVCTERTRRTLAGWGEECPPLDAAWLERFFGSLARHRVIPDVVPPARQLDAGRLDAGHPSRPLILQEQLVPLLRRHFDDPQLHVEPVGGAERLSQQSILTELTSWRCGSSIGLFRQSMTLLSGRAAVPARLEVVVKVKTEDRHLLEVVEAAAALCDPRVGAAFARWRSRLGFVGAHRREIALYQQDDDRWRRFTPLHYGSRWDEDHRRGLVVMEHLPAPLGDGGSPTWTPPEIEAAIRGLAELHAIWFERRAELTALPWLAPPLTATAMVEMSDLWTALAAHAARFFTAWLGPEVRRLQRRLLSRLERWWPPLEQLPRTLIHNDFNPRNIALRRTAAGPVLCAYDWELATLAVPQHDLAQLLCFVLPYDCPRPAVRSYLELHRQALQAATGRPLDAAAWEHGFGLALADLLIQRWAMYTLAHAVRRQPFLERVLHTWRTLYTYFDPCG